MNTPLSEPLNVSTISLPVQRVNRQERKIFDDLLAVEEPLEIRLDYQDGEKRVQKSISITMRTPGADFELAAGFLFTEGIIRNGDDIVSISHCGPALPHLGHSNVVKLQLRDSVAIDSLKLERHFYTSSSCGVCGKSSIAALKTQSQFDSLSDPSPLIVSTEVIQALPERLRRAQDIFDQTGGLHASALFGADGNLSLLREDVGRHNALDKVIGAAFNTGQMPLSQHILMVSGRVSFELVQKASMAGIRMLAAVGAPSSLAVELARDTDMTLIGFVREARFNIYTGAERIH